MTDLDQNAADLAQLREDVDYLTALLEPDFATLTGNVASGPAASATPSGRSGAAHIWHTLPPREAAQAWTTLTGWVDWLTDRYTLDDAIPTCWYRHGPIIDELDALRAAWTAAYLDTSARPTDAAYWHDLLDRTLTRLRGWDRYGCSAGTHHDETTNPDHGAARQARDDYLHHDIDTRARRHRNVPNNTPVTT